MKNLRTLFSFIVAITALNFKSYAQVIHPPVDTTHHTTLATFPDLFMNNFQLVRIVPQTGGNSPYYYTFRCNLMNTGNAVANTANVAVQLAFSNTKYNITRAELDSPYVVRCGSALPADTAGNPIKAIAPGQIVQFNVSGSCDVYGFRYALAYIDPDNRLKESNEKNNCSPYDMHPAMLKHK